MEQFGKGEIKNEFLGDELTTRITSFLKGEMDKSEVEDFMNEILDNKDKLQIFLEISDLRSKMKKASEMYKDEKAEEYIKRLLKDIYGK